MLSYALISTDNKNDFSFLKSALEEEFLEYELIKKNGYFLLYVKDAPSFELKLKKMNKMLSNELFSHFTAIIIPFYSEIFAKYLSINRGQVFSIFDVFIKYKNEQQIIDDSKAILNSIKKDDLETIKYYLESNGNANAAAEELYLHKNSYAYRIKNFTNHTQIDYNDLNSLLFIKLIISLNS